ncbi:MAG: hypothetical protein DHS80DRAFT_33069 [Piptocephalis tieghemiana]|nr:MAG: hypothetical protein DHS80DRAFT_33735 [Piptocephalis tieghemiana]KAI9226079.1 MAG: hypothetical protein DHS80DRAFT_33069 [Piptocephalis tieghemiana]
MPKATVEDILSSYLLGGGLYDSIPYKTFQGYFPQAYRDHSAVRSLYTQYIDHRRQVKQRVGRNLELELALVTQQTPPLPLTAQEASGVHDEEQENHTRNLASLDAPFAQSTDTSLVHFTEALRMLKRLEEAREDGVARHDRACQELLEDIRRLIKILKESRSGGGTEEQEEGMDNQIQETLDQVDATLGPFLSTKHQHPPSPL